MCVVSVSILMSRGCCCSYLVLCMPWHGAVQQLLATADDSMKLLELPSSILHTVEWWRWKLVPTEHTRVASGTSILNAREAAPSYRRNDFQSRGARGVSPRPVHSCCFVGRCFRGLVNSFSDCFKKLF